MYLYFEIPHFLKFGIPHVSWNHTFYNLKSPTAKTTSLPGTLVFLVHSQLIILIVECVVFFWIHSKLVCCRFKYPYLSVTNFFSDQCKISFSLWIFVPIPLFNFFSHFFKRSNFFLTSIKMVSIICSKNQHSSQRIPKTSRKTGK